ncbi:MAG: flagellar biosynthesis protein FlhA [Planctomycetota bacterium]|nr:flagellar biosynthesis protein FlhA [Planctomycetota bacterium]
MPPEATLNLRDAAVRWRGLLVPAGVVSLLLVIIIPVPPGLLDLLLAASITLAVLVLLTTIYVERPLDFSVFPTLLLGATMLRLVLNFASTRLILTRAPTDGIEAAGGVIKAFGDFVTGGQIAVGAILFLILVVVQFLVITRGSSRISEVAARFALDAMPGRQMAIDSDVAAGLITGEEARIRRDELGSQADFYGAMDGAGKFVRGDAIAGIVITLTNIAGGLYVGMVQGGLPLSRSVDIFTRLTIGDGLVTQVPALLLSLAAGLIVTRSSSDRHLPRAIVQQLFGQAEVLFLAAGFLIVLALTGLPSVPLVTLAGICLVSGVALFRRPTGLSTADSSTSNTPHSHTAPPTPTASKSLSASRGVASPFVEPLALELGSGLLGLAQGHGLVERIGEIREQVARELGFLLPEVLIRDNLGLPTDGYQFTLRGAQIADGRVQPTHPDAALGLLEHLGRVVRRHGSELLTRQQVHRLIDRLAERAPRLVEELVPAVVPTSRLHRVLGNLLADGVPIRDLETILETLGDLLPAKTDPDQLTELVRHRLARSICGLHRDEKRRLKVVTLDPELEETIEAHSRFSDDGLQTWLAPWLSERLTTNLAQRCQRQSSDTPPVVVLCSSPLARASVSRILCDQQPRLIVMSVEEVSRDTQVESLGPLAISLEEPASATQRRLAA